MKLRKKALLVALSTMMLGSSLGTYNLLAAENYYFDLKPLSGSQSELLLENPDRGLRTEVYFNVKTGKSMFANADQDGIEQLHEEMNYYQSDSPRLAQVYFYLTDYKEEDLDEQAFDNMRKYFEELKAHNTKAVLRFAYIWDDTNVLAQEPTTERVVEHIKQLEPFIREYRDQIHVLQAGMIGAWGEWDSGALSRMDEKKILNALLDYTPQDLYLQVRYMYAKNNNIDPEDHAKWDRVGFHDDFLIGPLHGWNTAGSNPQSAQWQQMTKESAYTLVDGEMIWGSANGMYTAGKSIDPILMAKRLQEHHFTSLSLTHNYKEKKKVYSMVDWQKDYIHRGILEKNGLRYEPEWFKDEKGHTIPRTMFEYIRDYLGYYLVADDVQVDITDDQIQVALKMNNYGFAAPIGLESFDIVLLDADYQVISKEAGCELKALQPGQEQTIQVSFDKPEKDTVYQVAVRLNAYNETPVRLANQTTYHNGYNIVGVLKK